MSDLNPSSLLVNPLLPVVPTAPFIAFMSWWCGRRCCWRGSDAVVTRWWWWWWVVDGDVAVMASQAVHLGEVRGASGGGLEGLPQLTSSSLPPSSLFLACIYSELFTSACAPSLLIALAACAPTLIRTYLHCSCLCSLMLVVVCATWCHSHR